MKVYIIYHIISAKPGAPFPFHRLDPGMVVTRSAFPDDPSAMARLFKLGAIVACEIDDAAADLFPDNADGDFGPQPTLDGLAAAGFTVAAGGTQD